MSAFGLPPSPPPGADVLYVWSQTSNCVIREIGTSLQYDLLLALISFLQLCMFLATLFFLAHLVSSIFIVINVIITITNVAGFMHFWGLVRVISYGKFLI